MYVHTKISTYSVPKVGTYLMAHPVAVRGRRVHGRVGAAAVAHVLPGGAGHEQLMLLRLLLVGLVAAAPCQLAQGDGVVAAPPI